MEPYHMSENFINKPKINFKVLTYFDKPIHKLVKICLEKTKQLLRLSQPHCPREQLSILW